MKSLFPFFVAIPIIPSLNMVNQNSLIKVTAVCLALLGNVWINAQTTGNPSRDSLSKV
jgi:hypothetical protein